MDTDVLRSAEALLGHAFAHPALLEQELTHASLADARLASNERLEFLGDAVLGLIICEYLFVTHPTLLEGELTKIKSQVVSRRSCAEVAVELGLDRLLLLGKGMGGRAPLPESVAAAVFESAVAALYLDAGWDAAKSFVLQHMTPRAEQAARLGHQQNFKSVLQQSLLQLGRPAPSYLVLDEKGPDHAKCFEICAQSGEDRFPPRWGPSKKDAEQQAALEALRVLGIVAENEAGEMVVSWPRKADA